MLRWPLKLRVSNASAIVGRTHVSVWWHAASVQDVGAMAAELRKLVATGRERLSILLVVEPDAGLSPQEPRRAALAMLRELGQRICAIAVVIEGGGFRGSGIRAMFSTMALLLRMPFNWLAFAGVQEAVRWLQTRGETGVRDEADLLNAVAALRPHSLAGGE